MTPQVVSRGDFLVLAALAGMDLNAAAAKERACRILQRPMEIGGCTLLVHPLCGGCLQARPKHDLYVCGRCKREFATCCLDRLDNAYCATCGPGVRAVRGD